ncbi:MAG: hypothetical protein WC728_05795 [Elusimicrobiota bacterium]
MLVSLVCALFVPAHAAAVLVAPLPAAPIVGVPLVGPAVTPLGPSLSGQTLPSPLISPRLTPVLRAPQAGPMTAIPQVRGAPVALPRPATPAELDFVAKASAELAVLADDIGAEQGKKGGAMTGQDFLDLIDAGCARYNDLYAGKAPSPEAFRVARVVQEQTLRVARALLDPKAPLMGQVRRVLSVWNVFNQEMAAAASKGTLEAIEEDARLFASQVEQSV